MNCNLNNVYCVCTTPNIYPEYANNWNHFNKSGNSFVLICDVTKGDMFGKNIFKFTEQDIRNNLNFTKNVSLAHWWNQQGNRNITWFYAHFRMLNFYLANPNYDYYWFFDDDVIVTDWANFFTKFDNDNSDFIAHFVFKNKGVKEQINIPVIDSNTYSQDLWFQRFPGDGDILPKGIQFNLFGSFFDVVRFSNRAMKELIALNNEGLSGYSEGFVPTMLNASGMNLNTILKANNTSDFITCDIIHKGIKTNWQWI